MRGFIFSRNYIQATKEASEELPTLGKSFLEMTTNYYWPLIDEVRPNLANYVPVLGPAKEVAETILVNMRGNRTRL